MKMLRRPNYLMIRALPVDQQPQAVAILREQGALQEEGEEAAILSGQRRLGMLWCGHPAGCLVEEPQGLTRDGIEIEAIGYCGACAMGEAL